MLTGPAAGTGTSCQVMTWALTSVTQWSCCLREAGQGAAWGARGRERASRSPQLHPRSPWAWLPWAGRGFCSKCALSSPVWPAVGSCWIKGRKFGVGFLSE